MWASDWSFLVTSLMAIVVGVLIVSLNVSLLWLIPVIAIEVSALVSWLEWRATKKYL